MKKIYLIAAAMLVAMAATAQTDKKCDNACANDSIVADTIVTLVLSPICCAQSTLPFTAHRSRLESFVTSWKNTCYLGNPNCV